MNDNCDGSGPHKPGTVRVLPLANKAAKAGYASANAILCEACFHRGMAWRIQRNKELADWAKYDLPKWEELPEYNLV